MGYGDNDFGGREKSGSSRGGFRGGSGGGSGGFHGNRSGGGGGGFQGDRQMHKTTCAECGADCEVPFKPAEGRPVYCRDCYRKKNPRF